MAHSRLVNVVAISCFLLSTSLAWQPATKTIHPGLSEIYPSETPAATTSLFYRQILKRQSNDSVQTCGYVAGAPSQYLTCIGDFCGLSDFGGAAGCVSYSLVSQGSTVITSYNPPVTACGDYGCTSNCPNGSGAVFCDQSNFPNCVQFVDPGGYSSFGCTNTPSLTVNVTWYENASPTNSTSTAILQSTSTMVSSLTTAITTSSSSAAPVVPFTQTQITAGAQGTTPSTTSATASAKSGDSIRVQWSFAMTCLGIFMSFLSRIW